MGMFPLLLVFISACTGGIFIALLLFIFTTAVFYFLHCFIKWLAGKQAGALSYHVEGRTLRVDGGVFFLQRKAIPLDRITDFALLQGPLMRIYGVWAMRVQTAGTGSATPEATLYAITNPEQVRDELLRRRDEAAVNSNTPF